MQYDVSGTSYYDNNGSQNYLVTTTTTSSTTTTKASSTTTTTASKSTSATTTTSTTTTTTTSAIVATTTTATTTSSKTTTTKSSASTGTSSCSVPAPAPTTELTPCSTWNLDSCNGSQTSYNSTGYDDRKWQTPGKGSSDYVSSFQDYRELTGYADVTYNSARTSATVTVNAFARTCNSILYSFGGATATSSNTYSVPAGFTGTLSVVATIPALNATLTLDPLYFIWDKQSVNVSATNNGQKVAIVELFGWPYNDVGKECVFLGKAGWSGVRIWPAMEHLITDYYYETDGQYNPWYFLYQPVSYRLTKNRMGTRDELRAMINTCRSNGVRVYADAVINHMTGGGNDIQLHRTSSGSSCTYWSGHNTTVGSPAYTHDFTYTPNKQTGARPALEFPAVPYGPTDFHCERSLNSWSDPSDLNYGWLVGLTDLNTESDYVRNRIATHLVDLLSIGFSGFRVDSAKHISPDNLAAIFSKVRQRLGGSFPDEFITWLEVLMGGEKDLLACQSSSYNYYTYLNQVLASNGISDTDIQKIKIWSSDYPKEFPICGSWILPPTRFVIQNDDHDQQTSGSSSRDMGSEGSVLIVAKDVAAHRAFEVELFTRTDGNWTVRNVLSSYSFMNNGASGFPDGLSDCSTYVGTAAKSGCLSMAYAPAYVADSCGYSVVVNGTWQQGAYTRVHRDMSIINAMRGWMGYATTTATALGLPSTCT
ncbi:hypothetical protein K450DRAFT_210259 [Umbelopsis ramanniana AG]|uniref:Glycosyl hydrolase family 13 catalytic domain-containing protein n=1 Tax=Umbelopsis ramanniana AG TaxID=1314678 RepID=A0AAD5E8P5_UMBRA|nr:uncharacterized protein K450DRAFT_210259 [Umbelopsis ramanniana AG]KAI8579463.1 hypothetical protein K450DRAFT_210259 [Umbelopsis ramanniana AG]